MLMSKTLLALALAAASGLALAKLPAPPPMDDAAKAKAAEAAAKTAWSGKVEAFQLCRSMDKVAAHAQKAGKSGTVTATPPCADPGAFVYPPPAATAAAPAAAPAKPGAAPAAPKKS
jgi:hypothetical protein